MAVYSYRTIIASMHDFKTNLAKYTRMLEAGDYAAVEVQRYNRRIGVFITENSQRLFEARDRNGFKPNATTMGEIGMRLHAVHSEDHIELSIIEQHDDEKTQQVIRTFPYSKQEIADITAALESKILLGDESPALEWNSLQLRRALLIIKDVPKAQWGSYSSHVVTPGQSLQSIGPEQVVQ